MASAMDSEVQPGVLKITVDPIARDLPESFDL